MVVAVVAGRLQQVTEELIKHAATIFDNAPIPLRPQHPAQTQTQARTPSPPLPPAPAGNLSPVYALGSAHTKVATVSALPAMPSHPVWPLATPLARAEGLPATTLRAIRAKQGRG
jgi:hypothetical protein